MNHKNKSVLFLTWYGSSFCVCRIFIFMWTTIISNFLKKTKLLSIAKEMVFINLHKHTYTRTHRESELLMRMSFEFRNLDFLYIDKNQLCSFFFFFLIACYLTKLSYLSHAILQNASRASVHFPYFIFII